MNVRITGRPLGGKISAISSKSHAHRALICAALAKTPSKIICDSVNDDIMATASCLNAMGAQIDYHDGIFTVNPIDPGEKKGRVFLNCRERGSTLRFLLPIVCALGLEAKIDMEGHLPQRPMGELVDELIRHGAKIEQKGSSLYVGGKLCAGKFLIAGNVSSQYISGILFAMCVLKVPSSLEVIGEVQSRSYIDMTLDAIREFGITVEEKDSLFSISGIEDFTGKDLRIEGDWSNAAFWLCAGAMGGNGICVDHLAFHSSQGDRRIEELLAEFGANVERENDSLTVKSAALSGIEIDASNIPDLVPVLCAVACAASGKTVIKNAERLRIKESDRLEAIYDMLQSLGACFTPTKDGIIIEGNKPLKGGSVNSYNDHRMAMTAAILSTICKGEVEILDAQCVKKSYPDFWNAFNALGGHAERTRQ